MNNSERDGFLLKEIVSLPAHVKGETRTDTYREVQRQAVVLTRPLLFRVFSCPRLLQRLISKDGGVDRLLANRIEDAWDLVLKVVRFASDR